MMRRIALLTLLLAGCSGEPPRADTELESEREAPAPVEESEVRAEPATDPRDVAFAPELQVDLDAMEKQESGLYILVLAEGEGPAAAPGDAMGVDYTVWLPDGSVLDSSFDHTPPAPLPMVLNETRLIAGWTEGVTGMRLGEKRRLVVPYDLAYGAAGRPGVPPYTTLIFEVELATHTPGAGA
jgi:FKBP-type peptidyl-prolyl cis-trans isomerase